MPQQKDPGKGAGRPPAERQGEEPALRHPAAAPLGLPLIERVEAEDRQVVQQNQEQHRRPSLLGGAPLLTAVHPSDTLFPHPFVHALWKGA